MERDGPGAPRQAPPEGSNSGLAAASAWLLRAFSWHVRAFLAANVALNALNVFTGPPWWAFWPLAGTGVLLSVHYLFYKAAAVDERWVEARVEELNLKSYDRSHIENLKARHGRADVPDGRRDG